jgi:hypothetical protein
VVEALLELGKVRTYDQNGVAVYEAVGEDARLEFGAP